MEKRMDTLFNDNLKICNEDLALLEQYKTAVASADRISDRRATTNNFFITLNGLFFSLNMNIAVKFKECGWVLGVLLISLLSSCIVCYVWMSLLRHYKEMNWAKFEVILALEQRLPSNVCGYEWYLLQKQAEKEKSFFRFEKYIPGIFVLLHLFVLVYYVFLRFL
ncbi:RipA family octameric membrane protein [Helicobacter felistomachi]|uniref:RipA family octameric membrane protein n=1 Tax=Helicobacter felistomachi TaxID=3040201 RepID=UPI002572AB45|nr:hypothetical protein [Helicobacter sp. NHP21005]